MSAPEAPEGEVVPLPVAPVTEGAAPPGFQPRSEAFRRFMVAPIVVAGLLFAATGALVFAAWRGGSAAGDRVVMRFSGDCTERGMVAVRARAEAIGLGDPSMTEEGGVISLTATLPGLPDDRVAVPALLVRQGRFEGLGPAGVVITNAELTEAQIRLDESGLPYTWVGLRPTGVEAMKALRAADPEGSLRIRIDHEQPTPRPNNIDLEDDGLRVLTSEGPTELRMREAADRAILLQAPMLDCELVVQDVVSANP